MEKTLLIWIENCQRNRIPTRVLDIQSKAKSIFQEVKANLSEKTDKEINETFNASHGWWNRFSNRVGLRTQKGSVQFL